MPRLWSWLSREKGLHITRWQTEDNIDLKRHFAKFKAVQDLHALQVIMPK